MYNLAVVKWTLRWKEFCLSFLGKRMETLNTGQKRILWKALGLKVEI